MTSLHPTVFYLMIEALAALVIAVSGLAFYLYKKNLNQKKRLTSLVERITKNAEERQQKLKLLLANNDEACSQTLKRETELYQFIVRLCTSKNSDILLDIDKEIEHYTNSLIETCQTHQTTPQDNAENNTSTIDTSESIAAEVATLRNDILGLQDDNQAILTAIKTLSENNAVNAPIEPVTPPVVEEPETVETITDVVIDEPLDNLEPTVEPEMTAEPTPTDIDEIIDITDSIEDSAEAASPPAIEEDVTDIDSLLEESQPSTPSQAEEPNIEEIPDDLLQQDELSVNDAATDIDALFDEVAKENIEKSSA